jgi:hypothetical protein
MIQSSRIHKLNVGAMETLLAMIKLDSTEDIKRGHVIPIGDDKECIVLFVLNDQDVMTMKLEKRVLH